VQAKRIENRILMYLAHSQRIDLWISLTALKLAVLVRIAHPPLRQFPPRHKKTDRPKYLAAP